VLGSRGRFQLSDAQHVVAVEHGYRTWPELKRAAETAKQEPGADAGLTPLATALYHGARDEAELLAANEISPYALWSVAALGRVDMLPAFFDADGRLRPEAWVHRPNLADVGRQPGAPPRDDPQDVLDEALGHAAHNGRDEAVAWLLDHGADVDGRPYLDVTPLHFAVQLGHASTVRLLLERGADPSIGERLHGGTPADWARRLDLPHLAALIEPLDSGLEYAPGDPVRLHVTVRRFPYISDEGGAVERAGHPEGWRAVADRVAAERVVNVSRPGAVSLPVVAKGPGFDEIARRVAEASLELYEELLELDNA
jgi:hypothetical protein